MLGFDPATGSSTVKIVQPNAAKRDKGTPMTVLAIDDAGETHLLREGRLTANNTSDFMKDKFAELSGLTEVPLMVAGQRSTRRWYVVANLDAEPWEIVAQAAEFSNACARARTLAGGGKLAAHEKDESEDETRPTFGLDEEGRLATRTRSSGLVEVRELQGYVYEALKKIVGHELRKPKRTGYCIDKLETLA